MPRTSSFTLHMNENKTLNASVNKNTTEDTTLYLVNAQCSVHYYKYKWNFINFSLSWSGKKSRCKLQCLVDGSVPQVMVDLINSFKQVKEISQINFDYISQKLASYFHQLCSSFKELPKMILNTQSNQVNLIYHHSKYRATFNSQSYKMLIWVTHRKNLQWMSFTTLQNLFQDLPISENVHERLSYMWILLHVRKGDEDDCLINSHWWTMIRCEIWSIGLGWRLHQRYAFKAY